ncbi:cyclodeaminase/cyclohydrolase family protein [Flavobacterium sp. WC2430]|uniref:cyclodeaminase/cyclohydrolase family protein n=1 Tax=Flavobacterium sp. WC2430 TaxID=3234137 RepID=UPI0034675B3C
MELLQVITGDLLEQFGSGKEIPGSGSAAAFQGMLSAKLLITVISLTKGKEKYAPFFPALTQMNERIESHIYPNLCRLFQQDSDHFERTINSRKERDRAFRTDTYLHNKLSIKALEELKVAVNIPLEIAKLCAELGKMAAFVFDNGFQAVRGDSHVALSAAFSGLSSCLSIIQLNLKSFRVNDHLWIEQKLEETNPLKLKFKELDLLVTAKLVILENEVKENLELIKDINSLIYEYKGKRYLSDEDIEIYSVALQNVIWKYRMTIWGKNSSLHPIDILKPEYIFRKGLSYNCYVKDEIDTASENSKIQVAGIIDQRNKIVLISCKVKKEVQNFTFAHELGHALLHKKMVLHRDLPIDGSKTNRNIEEYQADKFASYFLMPKKQVIAIFKEIFLTDKFIIDENTAFNLVKKGPYALRIECKNLRGLSRKLAKVEAYNNQYFKSISEIFNVSVETMAIRLEELGLLDF